MAGKRRRVYDKENPTFAARLNDDQYAIVEELAHKEGMDIGTYIRDVVLRQHVEGLNIKWPEGYYLKGRGGKRPGSGRPPKIGGKTR